MSRFFFTVLVGLLVFVAEVARAGVVCNGSAPATLAVVGVEGDLQDYCARPLSPDSGALKATSGLEATPTTHSLVQLPTNVGTQSHTSSHTGTLFPSSSSAAFSTTTTMTSNGSPKSSSSCKKSALVGAIIALVVIIFLLLLVILWLVVRGWKRGSSYRGVSTYDAELDVKRPRRSPGEQPASEADQVFAGRAHGVVRYA
ncbi:uncharacterized protein BXZ73DRAFT_102489 [Epithele typhae]|uniref:uncharacterized protein n=1 Tax=Epithele typhae TaxID=378194 RepID=UPI002007DA45|nr:uncharacterized protein BXZ73DRAFT_102489 [Epithele typhae]KAH9927982.1 hypothetical protein BXZ73DRAFT_102489 [Epithele typhae]